MLNQKGKTISSSPKQKKGSFLVNAVLKIISSQRKALEKSPLVFQFSEEAARANAIILSEFEFSVEKLLKSQRFTTLHSGSEFRDIEILEPVLKLHKFGEAISKYITSGVNYDLNPLKKYNEVDRLRDINYSTSNEINNKSAIQQQQFVEKAIAKEVERGWSFTLPRSIIPLLKDKIGFIPLGTAKQFKVKDGNIVEKYRLTQDCSQLTESGFSLNSFSLDATDSPEIDSDCFFGGCLNRVLIRILFFRNKYPSVPILLSKHDLDSAYRRLHIQLDHAFLESWTWGDLITLNFRMPFGGKPMAKKFSNVTDFISDMAQWLIDDPSWNPSFLKSSIIPKVPDPSYDAGYKEAARPLMDFIACNDIYVDSYIDDFSTLVALTNDSLILRAQHAVPLALEVLFRPLHADDEKHIKRAQLLAPEKLEEEGNLSETKTLLGVKIDTAILRVSLPIDKAQRYIFDINSLMRKFEAKEVVSKKELESIIGKLVHVSQIAPEGNMFMSRLRYRLKVLSKKNLLPRQRLLQAEDYNDLQLWKRIITSVTNIGRPINTIVNTVPSYIIVSDAAKSNGLGGWLSFGPAWRCEIPSHLLGIFSINLLETISAFWTLKLLFSYVKVPIRVLEFVDNSASNTWTIRNRFDPTSDPAHDFVCRAIGDLLLEFLSSILSSHLEGKKNVVADSLSRDTNLSLSTHEQLLRQKCSHLLPANFKIVQDNSEDLIKFLEHLASLVPSKKPTQMQRTRSDLQRGFSGVNTSQNSTLNQFSSKESPGGVEHEFAKPFATRSDMESWASARGLCHSRERLETSSLKLTRPFGTMIPAPRS